jgi:hypothetical protein
LEIVDKDWDQLAPHLFDYNWTFVEHQDKNFISQRIRKEYLEEQDFCLKVCKKYFSRLRDIFSDRLYNYGIRKALFLQSHASSTFFYLFNHKISFGIGEILSGLADVNLGIKQPLEFRLEILISFSGISHGEDVVLLLLVGREEIPLTKEELLMSNKLLDMLQEFNKLGHLSFNGIQLNELTKDNLQYMRISSPTNCSIEMLYDFGNGKFWDEILHDHVLEN